MKEHFKLYPLSTSRVWPASQPVATTQLEVLPLPILMNNCVNVDILKCHCDEYAGFLYRSIAFLSSLPLDQSVGSSMKPDIYFLTLLLIHFVIYCINLPCMYWDDHHFYFMFHCFIMGSSTDFNRTLCVNNYCIIWLVCNDCTNSFSSACLRMLKDQLFLSVLFYDMESNLWRFLRHNNFELFVFALVLKNVLPKCKKQCFIMPVTATSIPESLWIK